MVIASRLIDWKRLRSALGASRYGRRTGAADGLRRGIPCVEFSILIGVAISIVLFVPCGDAQRV